MSPSFAVEFPASIRPLLESEASEHGFDSVAAYLEALVLSNTTSAEADAALEVALTEGVDSGEAVDANESFWTTFHRHVDSSPSA